MMLGDNTVCLNVRGELKQRHINKRNKSTLPCLVISLDKVKENPEAITDALKAYTLDGTGLCLGYPGWLYGALTPAEQEWEEHGGGYFSHESICISNTADRDTRCLLEVLYEDLTLENVSCEY